jgi:hypothetical protein
MAAVVGLTILQPMGAGSISIAQRMMAIAAFMRSKRALAAFAHMDH